MPDKNHAPVFDLKKFTGESTDDVIQWRNYLVIDKPADTPTLLCIGKTPVWTQENHSLIIGKKKSRKTLFIVWLVAEYLKQGGNIKDILICDTEQGKKHVWNIREKIYKMTGQPVNILSLRGVNVSQRLDIIKSAVEESTLKIVVIDGIRDLLGNINDPDQCTDLVIYIERLTVAYNLHIVNVLHQNKTDNNARGHLGTELLNKAEITIELELDEQAGCTTVKCESSRDIPFEQFAFTHNAEELPETVSLPTKGKAMTESEQKERLKHVFDSDLLRYKPLIENIKAHFEVGSNKAGHLLGTYLRNGWIVKNGKDKSPETVYKLMFT